MGLALMALIWLITLASTYFFVAKTWWLPAGAAEAAHFIDGQLALTFVLMGIVFLAAQLSLGYIVWRYREQASSPPVQYSHGNMRLEIVWTVLTTILFVGLNLMGSSVWASQRFDQAGPGAVQVEVTGMQFAWYFRYAGPDGKYGATSPKLMDPSAGRSRSGSEFASGGCDPQLFRAFAAVQARRGSGIEYSHALQADSDRRV